MRPLLSPLLLLFLVLLTGCASVGHDPTSRTMGTVIDDEMNEGRITRAIRNSHPELEDAHLVVTSFNGVVLLAGQVPSEEARGLAQEAAAAQPKVRRVHNELTVAGPTSYVARSGDAYITAKVKAALLATEDVEATRVKVVTENGVVYLMGLVPRSMADAAVARVRNVYGVQKIVKVFEYVEPGGAGAEG